jgi:hypothetical protein
MVWLSADWEVPSFAAARVKLRSSRHRREGGQVAQILASHS